MSGTEFLQGVFEVAEMAGDLKPIATAIASMTALAVLLNMVLTWRLGKSEFAGLMDRWLLWGLILLLSFGVVAIYLWNEANPVDFDLSAFLFLTVGAMGLGLIILGLTRGRITKIDNHKFLAGRRLRSDADAIMDGRWDDVAAKYSEWVPISRRIPQSLPGWWDSVKEHDKTLDDFRAFVWTKGGLLASSAQMWLGTTFLLGGATATFAIIGTELIDVERQEQFNVDSNIIVFETNTAKPIKFQEARMRAIAYAIARQEPLCLIVTGHTDSRDSSMGNDVLSKLRADFVADWLLMQDGLGDLRMQRIGRGYDDPFTPEAGISDETELENAQQSNRRVEIDVGRDEADCIEAT